MPRLPLPLFIVVLSLLFTARPARASDDEAPAYAVQNREFSLKHEIHLGVGVLPINAFTKGITVAAGYTYHFTNLWAWEVVQLAYSFGVDTALKTELLTNFAVQATSIQSLNYFASSNVVFKPLYGKLALANRWLVHLEVFLEAGPAFAVYQNPTARLGGFDVGVGLRFFVNQLFSLRLDIRDYSFIKGGPSVESELFLGVAGAITFGGGGQ